MVSFKNDYSEGAHPAILQALCDTNMVQQAGYGEDAYSLQAKALIKERIGSLEMDIHFIPGGTLTNLIAISSALRPHEACIAPATGHIATHEAGAIESTGHKIIELQTDDGKLTPSLIAPSLASHHFEHMVKPKMVYISNPTELGTVYTTDELKALYAYCQEHQLLLYMDGARLGMALTANGSGVTLEDIAAHTDVFFIGGAKVGALIGEALVITNDRLKEDMLYMIKQRGALFSKGRLMGLQFLTLFQDGLYEELADHANKMAQKIATALSDMGCDFLIDSPTNQLFPILKNKDIEALRLSYEFYEWQEVDEERTAIRLITSWATTEETVDAFIHTCRRIIING